MKKIHKIVMGAVLGGLAMLPQSKGYGGAVSAAVVNTTQYRDTAVSRIQNVDIINAKPTATPAVKISVKPSPTPEAKPTGKITATPEPKPSGKVTATPEPKPSGKVTVTPEPKSSPKETATPAPKVSVSGNRGALVVAESLIVRLFSFFGGWFKK